jgi:hypothetical protein
MFCHLCDVICLLPGEKPIKQELLELFRGMWVVFWNAALFLAFADVLHRSLDWCCQVSSAARPLQDT